MHQHEAQHHNHGSGSVAMAHDGPPSTAAALLTVGVAGFAWVVAFQQMNHVHMAHLTGPGSFPFFNNWWMWMLAAMMLPAAAPAAFTFARANESLHALLLFVGSYLGVWTLVGVALYAVYPFYAQFGSFAAGTVAIAAGAYELTPLKQHLRERRGETFGSGVQFGLCCVGSSIGLMLVLLAVDLMSVTWMVVLTVVMLAQQYFRRNR